MTALDEFRGKVKSWIAANLPAGSRARMTGAGSVEFVALQKEWFAIVSKSGYATPRWGPEWPGGGRSLDEQIVIFEEMARADAPRLLMYFLSLYHAAMTISHWGTELQKKQHLQAVLKGTIWRQGFSEPNAGSDLASLRTRAVRSPRDYQDRLFKPFVDAVARRQN